MAKSITDRLREILGEHYTEQVDASIKAMIGEGFVARDDFNGKSAALKAANDKIAELSADDWHAKYDELDKTSKQMVADAEAKYNQYRLATELKAARARNPKAVSALLDSSKITYTDDGIDGLKEQLDALVKSDGYLFEAPAGVGAGGFPAGNGGGDGAGGGKPSSAAPAVI